jgi:hypothetical protein
MPTKLIYWICPGFSTKKRLKEAQINMFQDLDVSIDPNEFEIKIYCSIPNVEKLTGLFINCASITVFPQSDEEIEETMNDPTW